jgi:hypothetical protein
LKQIEPILIPNMSDFYKKTDNQLRDKLAHHEFDQMPAAWSQMEQMLQANPATATKAGGGIFWWALPTAAAAVLAGIITVGVYLNPNTTKNNNNNTTVLAEVETEVVATSNTTRKAAYTTAGGTTTTNINPVVEKTVAIPAINNSQNNNLDENKTAEKNTLTPRTATVTPPTNTTHNTVRENVSDENNNILSATAPALSQPEEIGLTDMTIKRPVKKTKTIVRYQYSMTPFKAMSKKKRAIENTLPEGALNAFGITEENYNQSPKLRAGVFAGVSTKVIGSTQKVSVMPTGGVTLNYRMSGKSALQTGLQYKAIDLKGVNNSNTTEEQNFRPYSNTAQAYSLDRIDVLEMPLVYQYYPNPKFNMKAGVKGAWLFNKEFSDPSLKGTNNSAIGLATFDLGALLGIEVLINKNLSVGLQYSVGLMNLTEGAKQTHQVAIKEEADYEAKAANVLEAGEVLVPTNPSQDKMVRLPRDIRNNDLQLLVKYTF